MPHLKLEYSDNISKKIDFDILFTRLHQSLAEIGGINIDNCKSRAFPLETFLIANGHSDQGFIHLEVKFLEGRSPELKKMIGKKLLHEIKKMFTDSPSNQKIQITVEILDIINENYFKYKFRDE
jgi:5-carboxymethyl-2-hydroxymuconate isomerase